LRARYWDLRSTKGTFMMISDSFFISTACRNWTHAVCSIHLG
jgi:hypothetical protein